MKRWNLCCRFSEQASESRTPLFQRFCYGVGHVIHDIFRQLLFSFRLVFFMRVLGLSAANAGWLILQKQLAHVVFSPICAFLVDRINIPFLFRKLGQRKSWLLIGTALEAIFIPLFFSSCFPCQSDGGQWQLMIYIGILNTILAFAGTLMNIGHLSIIPAIAKDQSEAVEMSAWRTSFSFLSGIVTLAVAWAIFGQDTSGHLSGESAMDFTVMTLILVGIGVLFAVIFQVGTKEPSDKTNTKSSITVADIMRKTSSIASHTILQSMAFMGRDVESKKERMRDRFLDSLKTKEGQVTDEGNPVRKKSFARHFMNSLFTINEENEEENKTYGELPPDNKRATEAVPRCLEMDVPSPRSQDDEEMINVVKELPKERKISILVSIIFGLVGEDASTSEKLPKGSEQTNSCNGMKSSDGIGCAELPTGTGDLSVPSERNSDEETHGTERVKKHLQTCCSESTESLGIENKGRDYDETELSPCNPDITDTNVDEKFSNNLSPDSLERNCGPSPETNTNGKPSHVYDDPESAFSETPTPKTIRAWLKDPHLYKVAIIFACTKVLQDVSYAYLPLFLIYRVHFEKDAIAYLPLIMLISATVSSGISKKLVGIIGNKCLFTLASLLVIGAGVWFYFISQSNSVMTYPAVTLLGFGFSIMLVNALSFAAELIGENKSTSGVVFAFMGLMSNVTGGTLFGVIQKFFPQGSNTSEDCEECGDFVRHVFSFVPGSLAAICLLIVLLFQVSETICKQKVTQTDATAEKDEDTASLC